MSTRHFSLTGAIETAFEFFAGRASTGFIIPEWFPTPENFQYHVAVASLDSAVYGIIDARQRELALSAQPPQVHSTAHYIDTKNATIRINFTNLLGDFTRRLPSNVTELDKTVGAICWPSNIAERREWGCCDDLLTSLRPSSAGDG